MECTQHKANHTVVGFGGIGFIDLFQINLLDV